MAKPEPILAGIEHARSARWPTYLAGIRRCYRRVCDAKTSIFSPLALLLAGIRRLYRRVCGPYPACRPACAPAWFSGTPCTRPSPRIPNVASTVTRCPSQDTETAAVADFGT